MSERVGVWNLMEMSCTAEMKCSCTAMEWGDICALTSTLTLPRISGFFQLVGVPWNFHLNALQAEAHSPSAVLFPSGVMQTGTAAIASASAQLG